ncbi:MAG: hypothetical protein ACFHVJ_07770 [Aestuariibacter sp.]
MNYSIFKLKQWFSLTEAANYFSLKFDYLFGVEDVLQFALTKELRVSWLLNERWVRRVEKVASIYLNQNEHDYYTAHNKFPPQMEDKLKGLPDNIDKVIYPDLTALGLFPKNFKQEHIWTLRHRCCGEPFRVSGAYRFDFNHSSILCRIADWLTKKDQDFTSLDGEVLLGPDGETVVPVDFMPLTEDDMKQGKISTHERDSYPTDDRPEMDDIVILSEDLETFINSTLTKPESSPYAENQLSETLEDNYLITIGALLELLKEKRLTPYTQDLIISQIEEKYSSKSLSKSTLTKRFSAANRLLKEHMKK